jgi:hypothetical protein
VSRRAAAAVVLALAFACAAPASAGNGVSGVIILFGGIGNPATIKSWDLPVRFQGSVVVTFQSSFGSGTIVWGPSPSGQFTVAENRTSKRRQMTAFLAPTGGSGAAARVERPGGLCTDVSQPALDEAVVVSERNGIRVGLAGATANGDGFHMTETRCGGPLLEDVGRALGTVAVTRSQLHKGNFDLDLRRSAPLAVAGMTGSVTSTVVAHVGRRAPAQRGPRAVPGGAPTERERQLDVRYAVERVTGDLSAQIRGGGEVCTELDSCDASETLALHLGKPAGGTLDLTASGPARRPLADFRAAVGLPQRGGNAGHVDLSGNGTWGSHATTLSAVMTRGGEEVCRDTRHKGGLFLEMRRSAGRIVADLSFRQLTRTSCPGPSLSESGYNATTLATTALPLSALRHGRLTLHLEGGAPLETDGWSGWTRGSVTIVLRRTRVKTSVFRY